MHAQDCISANAVGRCVRTVHHLDHFTTPELAACHEKAMVEPYAHLCVSAAVAAELRAGWGLTATVIPHGVDHARFATAGPGDWRERLGRYVLVAAADVFAFPSTKEGFGLAAMEALAAGVPVVVRDLPVLREVVGPAVRYDTESASLAAAMRAAVECDEPDRRAAGRALAAAHTWKAAAERHLAFYRSLS